jgi:hypothetical protein
VAAKQYSCCDKDSNLHIKNSKLNKYQASSLLNRLCIIETFRFEGVSLVQEIPVFDVMKEAVACGNNLRTDQSDTQLINLLGNENIANSQIRRDVTRPTSSLIVNHSDDSDDDNLLGKPVSEII